MLASTVTCSPTAPTFNGTSMVRLLSTCSTMPVWIYVLKPALDPSNMYGPSARAGNTYLPSSPQRTVRTAPVAVWVTLTSAPGLTAPVSSWIVPPIGAVACDQATSQERNKQQRESRKERISCSSRKPTHRNTPIPDNEMRKRFFLVTTLYTESFRLQSDF